MIFIWDSQLEQAKTMWLRCLLYSSVLRFSAISIQSVQTHPFQVRVFFSFFSHDLGDSEKLAPISKKKSTPLTAHAALLL